MEAKEGAEERVKNRTKRKDFGRDSVGGKGNAGTRDL